MFTYIEANLQVPFKLMILGYYLDGICGDFVLRFKYPAPLLREDSLKVDSCITRHGAVIVMEIFSF